MLLITDGVLSMLLKSFINTRIKLRRICGANNVWLREEKAFDSDAKEKSKQKNVTALHISPTEHCQIIW